MLKALNCLASLGVKEAGLPLLVLLDDVALEDLQYLPAVEQNTLLVRLLTLQLHTETQVVADALVGENAFEVPVRRCLDYLHQGVVVYELSSEHLLEFAKDAEVVEN